MNLVNVRICSNSNWAKYRNVVNVWLKIKIRHEKGYLIGTNWVLIDC